MALTISWEIIGREHRDVTPANQGPCCGLPVGRGPLALSPHPRVSMAGRTGASGIPRGPAAEQMPEVRSPGLS